MKTRRRSVAARSSSVSATAFKALPRSLLALRASTAMTGGVIAAMLVLVPEQAASQTPTWTWTGGAGTSNFQDSGNWLPSADNTSPVPRQGANINNTRATIILAPGTGVGPAVAAGEVYNLGSNRSANQNGNLTVDLGAASTTALQTFINNGKMVIGENVTVASGILDNATSTAQIANVTSFAIAAGAKVFNSGTLETAGYGSLGLRARGIENSGYLENRAGGLIKGGVVNNASTATYNPLVITNGAVNHGTIKNETQLVSFQGVTGEMSNQAVYNRGLFINGDSGLIEGPVVNASDPTKSLVADFYNYGLITGAVTNTSGFFYNGSGTPGKGVITGDVTVNGGSFTNSNGQGGLAGVIMGNVTVAAGALFTQVTAGSAVQSAPGNSLGGKITNSGTVDNSGYVTGVVTNNAGTFNNHASGQLTLASGFHVINGGTFNNSGSVTAGFDIKTGGTVNNYAGATVGTRTYVGGALNNSGSLNIVTMQDGGVFTNNAGGTFTQFQGFANSTFNNNVSLNDNLNVSFSTFNNNAGASVLGTFASGGTVNNSGTLGISTVTGGTFNNKSGGLVGTGGSVTFLHLSGNIHGLATFNNEAGATVRAGGMTQNNNGVVEIVNAGIITSGNFNNSGTVEGSVDITGGTFTNNGSLDGMVRIGTGGKLVLNGNAATAFTQPKNVQPFTVPGVSWGLTNNGSLVVNLTGSSEINTVILGTGGLEQRNAGGILTLGADNTYTGKTIVSGGTLNINGASASSAYEVGANAHIVFNSNANSALTKTVTGEGNFTKRGTGTMTANNTLLNTGMISVEAGKLQVGAGSFLAPVGVLATSGSGEIDLGANLVKTAGLSGSGGKISGTNNLEIETASGTYQYRGVIEGAARSLTKLGVGTQELYGVNTYGGGTSINAGVLKVGSASALGSGGVSVAAGASLGLGSISGGPAVDFTFDKAITGEGGLIKTGANTVTLTGANTYSGATRIEAGTLKIGVGGSLNASSLITVLNGATFDFGAISNPTIGSLGGTGGSLTGGTGNLTVQMGTGTTDTFSGTNPFGGFDKLILTGDGKLNLTGDLSSNKNISIQGGTLNLTGNNAGLTGGITVNGKLIIGSNNAAGGAGNTITTTGSVIDYDTVATPNLNVATPININSNTTQLQVLSGTATQSGVISETRDPATPNDGRPVEKIGAGTLILSAANTYTGKTTITAGTLDVSGSIASTVVTVQDTATLKVAGTSLADTAAVTLNGIGNLTLTGSETIGSLASNSTTSTVTLGGNTLTTGGDNTGTVFAGVISGTGGLTKAGSGNMALTGANGYSGTTTINGGTLQIGAGGTAGTLGSGNVVNNGTLLFNRSDDITVSNVISGTGSVTKTGAGKLTLGDTMTSPTHTFSGAVTISAGTVAIQKNTNLGNDSATNRLILNGGTLDTGNNVVGMARSVTVGANGGTVKHDQLLALQGNDNAFTGRLTKTGSGVLVLTGNGSGSGGIFVEQSSLSLATNTSAGTGTIAMNGGTTLNGRTNGMNIANNIAIQGKGGITLGRDFAGVSYTLSGNISGNSTLSSLQKVQDGTINLTGNNTFQGGVTLAAGTLGVGSNTALGTGTLSAQIGTTLKAVANNLNLANNIVITQGMAASNQFAVDTNGFNMTLSGVISTNVPATEQVQPGLTKDGAGDLILTGVNTYRGATIVNAGRLIVNGSIANTSSVTIANGATLGGNAAIPNLVVHSGATISPGNSIGVVNIAGNLTLNAGSTTIIEIQQAQADRINAGGTASIAGTLSLVALGGPYVFSSPYTIITAAGGRSGTFAKVNTDAAFGVGVTSTVNYNPTSVQVTLNAAQLATLSLSRPRNAVAVAAGLDRAVAAGADASPFFAIYNQPSIAALTAAVNTLSGEVHSSASAMGFQSSDQFLRVMLDPTNIGRNAQLGLAGVSIWGAAYGQTGRTNGESTVGSARRSSSDWNMAFGADVRVHPTTIIGVAASGGQSSASLAGNLGKASADVFQFGVHSMSRFGAVSLNVAGSWSILDVDTNRTVPALGAGAVKAGYQAQVWSGRAEAAYAAWRLSETFAISPFAAIQAASARTPGFVERVNGAVAAHSLSVNGQSNGQTRSELGLRLDFASFGPSGNVSVYARAAWAHYFTADSKASASLTGLAGSAFTVTGARPSQNSAIMGLGADVNLGRGLTFGAVINAELAARQAAIGGSAKLRMAF